VENIADVSPNPVTFGARNSMILFGSGQNRTQDADGSIPFISAISLRIFSSRRVCKTFEEQTFCIQEAFSRP
jgi:hypothetical protein